MWLHVVIMSFVNNFILPSPNNIIVKHAYERSTLNKLLYSLSVVMYVSDFKVEIYLAPTNCSEHSSWDGPILPGKLVFYNDDRGEFNITEIPDYLCLWSMSCILQLLLHVHVVALMTWLKPCGLFLSITCAEFKIRYHEVSTNRFPLSISAQTPNWDRWWHSLSLFWWGWV